VLVKVKVGVLNIEKVSVLRVGCIIALPAMSVENVKVEKDPNVAEVVPINEAAASVGKATALLFEKRPTLERLRLATTLIAFDAV